MGGARGHLPSLVFCRDVPVCARCIGGAFSTAYRGYSICVFEYISRRRGSLNVLSKAHTHTDRRDTLYSSLYTPNTATHMRLTRESPDTTHQSPQRGHTRHTHAQRPQRLRDTDADRDAHTTLTLTLVTTHTYIHTPRVTVRGRFRASLGTRHTLARGAAGGSHAGTPRAPARGRPPGRGGRPRGRAGWGRWRVCV